MSKSVRRLLCALLCILMIAVSLPLQTAADEVLRASYTGSASALKQNDSFMMGMYPQSLVTDSGIISALSGISCEMKQYDYVKNANSSAETYDAVGMYYADLPYNGRAYRKVVIDEYRPEFGSKVGSSDTSFQYDNGYYAGNTYYFLWEPIEWKVLANEGSGKGVLVMAQMLLDSPYYRKLAVPTTWETSYLKDWLDKSFYVSAFSDDEKSKMMKNVYNVNDDGPWQNNVPGGNPTYDTVWILSYKEVINPDYGFLENNLIDDDRKAKGTDYAKCQGLEVSTEAGESKDCSVWWLRNPGYYDYAGATTLADGELAGSSSAYVSCVGVRPVFRLDYNATISAVDTSIDRIVGKPDYTAPVWEWDSYSSAKARFTYTDGHSYYVYASVENEIRDGKIYGIATASYAGSTYTDERAFDYFSSHSLSLNGSIGVNFYLDLLPEQLSENPTVDFLWTVNGVEKTSSVTLSQDDKTDDGYKATCPVAAAEMTYDITASLTIDGVLHDETDTYSVKSYADLILTDESFRTKFISETSKDKYDRLTTLVKTMLYFGAKAQKHFKRNESDLADKDLISDDEGSPYYFVPADVTPDMIKTDATDMNAADFSTYGLQYSGSTIVFLSETSMRHYFKITDRDKFDSVKGNITFGSDTPIGYTVKGDEIYFELKNISAPDLDTLYTLSIDGAEYRYSVLDYVKACLASDKTGDDMKALAAAAYLYNQAANAYFGG